MQKTNTLNLHKMLFAVSIGIREKVCTSM